MRNSRVPDEVLDYFLKPELATHKQYDAIRAFYVDKLSAEEVAEIYGYQPNTIYSIARNFKEKLKECKELGEDPFFKELRVGPKETNREDKNVKLIVEYRKKMLSIPEIAILMAGQGYPMSTWLIWQILIENGFTRMPKRDKETIEETQKNSNYAHLVTAPEATVIEFNKEIAIPTKGAGILCFLLIIKKYGIDRIIERSEYPGTKQIPKLNTILCFLVLKLSDFERYGHDDAWCFDRGLGLFAGLNVLPKTTWFSIYADKILRSMNVAFLKECNNIWIENGFLSDTVNMDFVTIPYWGDTDTFERNWSGKRNKALESIEAALAHDPESGIICYGDTTVKHDNQNEVVLEFLDFYSDDKSKDRNLKYLVFDSKFTTLENLRNLEDKGIKFITIQRKSKNQQEKANAITDWKKARIRLSNGKGRDVYFHESEIKNYRYGKDKILRQIFIKGGHARISCIITNDLELFGEQIIRKYARRWLIENEIQEHVDFFHLNSNTSDIVIKVDFDLTMTILAHNLYRLLANEIPGYEHCTAKTIFNKITDCMGDIDINESSIDVKLFLKRTTPLLLESLPSDSHGFSRAEVA